MNSWGTGFLLFISALFMGVLLRALNPEIWKWYSYKRFYSFPSGVYRDEVYVPEDVRTGEDLYIFGCSGAILGIVLIALGQIPHLGFLSKIGIAFLFTLVIPAVLALTNSVSGTLKEDNEAAIQKKVQLLSERIENDKEPGTLLTLCRHYWRAAYNADILQGNIFTGKNIEQPQVDQIDTDLDIAINQSVDSRLAERAKSTKGKWLVAKRGYESRSPEWLTSHTTTVAGTCAHCNAEVRGLAVFEGTYINGERVLENQLSGYVCTSCGSLTCKRLGCFRSGWKKYECSKCHSPMTERQWIIPSESPLALAELPSSKRYSVEINPKGYHTVARHYKGSLEINESSIRIFVSGQVWIERPLHSLQIRKNRSDQYVVPLVDSKGKSWEAVLMEDPEREALLRIPNAQKFFSQQDKDG